MKANRSRGFQNFWVIETGFFDFDKMTVAALWFHLPKLGPKIVNYSGFKNFWNEKFWSLSNKECQKFQNNFELDCFLNIYVYFHSILLHSVLFVLIYNIAECSSTWTFNLLYILYFLKDFNYRVISVSFILLSALLATDCVHLSLNFDKLH